MTQLATVGDLNVLQGTQFGEADTRPVRLIELASSVVQAEARQVIAEVTGDVAQLEVVGGEVWLPERPVLNVTTVIMTDYNTSPGPQPITGFTWTRYGLLRPGTLVRSDRFWPPEAILTVTYDHGFASVPDLIVAITCAVVGRMLSRSPDTLEIDDPDEMAGTASLDGYLTEKERKLLRRFRPSSHSVPVRTAR